MDLLMRGSISAVLYAMPVHAWAQDPVPVPAEPPPAAPAEPAGVDPPPAPADVTPPVDLGTQPPDADGEDDYARLLRDLPNDYDLNYTFVAPPKQRGRSSSAPGAPADVGTGTTKISRESAKRMRVAGGSVLAAGLVTFGVSLGLGLGGVGEKDGYLWMISGVPVGAVMTLTGGTLVGVGRKASRVYGDLPSRGSKPQLTDKQRKNNIFAASLGWLFGVIGVGSGAAILAKDDDSSSGAALLAVGVISMGVGTYSTIRLLVNKSRRTASVSPAPLFVRGGAGVAATARF